VQAAVVRWLRSQSVFIIDRNREMLLTSWASWDAKILRLGTGKGRRLSTETIRPNFPTAERRSKSLALAPAGLGELQTPARVERR